MKTARSVSVNLVPPRRSLAVAGRPPSVSGRRPLPDEVTHRPDPRRKVSIALRIVLGGAELNQKLRRRQSGGSHLIQEKADDEDHRGCSIRSSTMATGPRSGDRRFDPGGRHAWTYCFPAVAAICRSNLVAKARGACCSIDRRNKKPRPHCATISSTEGSLEIIFQASRRIFRLVWRRSLALCGLPAGL